MNNASSTIETIESLTNKKPAGIWFSTRTQCITYAEAMTYGLDLGQRILNRSDTNRPAIVAADGIRGALVVLACLTIRKPFIPINPAAPRKRLSYYVEDSGADILVSENQDGKNELASTTDLAIDTIPVQGDWCTVGNADDITCMIYTSGSTGDPKAVVCPESSVSFARDAISSTLGYTEDDIVMSALPTYFDYGLYQILMTGSVGATLYFASAAESGFSLGRTIRNSGATILPLVPTSAEKMARLVNRGATFDTVRMVTTTGAALTPQTRKILASESAGQIDLRAMYGLTECKRVSIMPSRESATFMTSSGLPLPGTDVSIRDSTTFAELDSGEIGEICVTGPHLMNGYHNQPELTHERYVIDGSRRVLRTGDYGYMDANGYLHCLGRADSQYKVRGHRVSAVEIVNRAMEIDGMTSAVVLPPDESTEHTIVYEGDVRPSDLRRTLVAGLESYAVPEKIVHLPELPLLSNGKTDIVKLREELSNG